MSLLALPIEILAIVASHLDTKSIYNLYETCIYLRNAVPMLRDIKEYRLSLNSLATAKTLKSDFFRDISGHIKVLNLSGVHDLNKSSLIPALRRLKNLVDLDVTYTNILMPDYLEIVKVKPTLKSLAINFSFGSKKNYKITNSTLQNYQQAFKELESIHFVGSKFDLVYGKMAAYMLNNANLSNLKLTIFGGSCLYYNYDNEDDWNITVISQLSQFHIYFTVGNHGIIGDPLLELPIFKLLDINNYELIMIMKFFKTNVYATPYLKELILENFSIDVKNLSALPPAIAEAVVILWNKECTIFDSAFRANFLKILQEYLVYSFNSSDLIPVPAKYKWYYIEQCSPNVDDNLLVDDTKFKKARVAQPSLVLNYDNAFQDTKDIKLQITFEEPFIKPVSINDCDFLKKLSHLFLCGNVQYSSDFFKNLFDCCNSLVTLQIIKMKGSFSIPTLLKSLPNCKSLKNILIKASSIHYFSLFTYLSECTSLENIYLINTNTPIHTLPNPSELFSNCTNLYNICVQSDMADMEKMLRFYKQIRSKLAKDCLNIEMLRYTGSPNLHNPYFSVFNVYHLKPL